MKRNRTEKFLSWMPSNAALRFRILVSDKVAGSDELFLKDKDFVPKLYVQLKLVETERDRLLKSLTMQFIILFFLVNGSDFTLPLLNLPISGIPSLREIVVIIISFSLIMFGVKFQDGMCYKAIIDGVIISQNGNDTLKNHIIKSSLTAESGFWLLFRRNYTFGSMEKLMPGKRARLFNFFMGFVLIVALLLCLFGALAYLCYVALFIIERSVFGWGIIGFALISVVFTLFLFFMQAFNFPYDLFNEDIESK